MVDRNFFYFFCKNILLFQKLHLPLHREIWNHIAKGCDSKELLLGCGTMIGNGRIRASQRKSAAPTNCLMGKDPLCFMRFIGFKISIGTVMAEGVRILPFPAN